MKEFESFLFMNRKQLSIVIPMCNEEENVHELYFRLKNVLQINFSSFIHQLVFVDDGSIDNTYSLLKALSLKDHTIKVVQFSRNFGQDMAITGGLDYADGNIIVTMDGDLQDKPEDLVKLYEKFQQGYDVVFVDRLSKKFSLWRRVGSKCLFFVIRLLVNENIVINSNVFRMMSRQVVDEVKMCRETSRYILGLIGWIGFKHTSIAVEHVGRKRGKTKYTFFKLVRLALDAIFAFSDYPLRFIMRIGFGVVLLSIMVCIYFIFERIFYGVQVAGWTSLILAIFFVGGLHIILLGIIGEYLGRTYMETKKRPLYIVKKVISYELIDNLTVENGELCKKNYI